MSKLPPPLTDLTPDHKLIFALESSLASSLKRGSEQIDTNVVLVRRLDKAESELATSEAALKAANVRVQALIDSNARLIVQKGEAEAARKRAEERLALTKSANSLIKRWVKLHFSGGQG